MKILLFCKLSLLLISVLLPQSVFAQDYTRWELPEGATARLGKGSISDIAYSPDGERLAVASSIGIWIYNAHTGAELALLTGHSGRVYCVAFRPGMVRHSPVEVRITPSGLWDAATGAQKQTLKGHMDSVNSVAFSPDGRTLASGGADNAIRLWNAVTGALKQSLAGHTSPVNSVAFSPDGGDARQWESGQYHPAVGCNHRHPQQDSQRALSRH